MDIDKRKKSKILTKIVAIEEMSPNTQKITDEALKHTKSKIKQ